MMKMAKRVPSYEVEFLPLERRLVERRVEAQVYQLAVERRRRERRHTPEAISREPRPQHFAHG